MADVEHAVGAEVPADGPLVRLEGIGGPEDGTDALDDAGAGEAERDDGGGLHEGRELGEEGLAVDDEVDDVGVVLAEEGIIELHQLEAAQAETLGEEALQDDTGEVLADAVRLEENECFFVSVHRKNEWLP